MFLELLYCIVLDPVFFLEVSFLLFPKKSKYDKANTKSPSVAKLENGINGLVYTLYGLNEKDVAVIDDFLRRF